jgi:hypothetical protein
MFCTKCRKENKDDASLCVQCGATLGKQESPVAEKSSGGKFWKGFVVAIVAIVAIWMVIGRFLGPLSCESPSSVATYDATGITANQATLNGDLTRFWDAPSTDVSFQWGTSSGSYPNETDAVARISVGAFSVVLTRLNSNTTYYYRAKADSGGYGTRYGDERSFTTP